MIHASRLTLAGSGVALALLVGGRGRRGSHSAQTTTTCSGGGGKGGTMNLVANAAPSGSADPQINYTLQEWQLLIFTHDGLVAFKRVGGKAGTELVPDLAETIPTPTNG